MFASAGIRIGPTIGLDGKCGAVIIGAVEFGFIAIAFDGIYGIRAGGMKFQFEYIAREYTGP